MKATLAFNGLNRETDLGSYQTSTMEFFAKKFLLKYALNSTKNEVFH